MCAKKYKKGRARQRIYIPYESEHKGPSWMGIVIMFAIFWPVGAFLLLKRLGAEWHNRKLIDYRNYATVIGDRYEVEVRELSAKLGKTPSLVMSDLQVMIDKGYLGTNAYVDRSRGVLVMDALETEFAEEEPEMAFDAEKFKEELRKSAETIRDEVRKSGVADSIRTEFRRVFDVDAAQESTVESRPEPEPAPRPAVSEDDFEAKLREIKKLNDEIDDEAVSDRIDRIGELTLSIFTVVRQKPERADEVKKFMNYYLPTTFKLLKSYSLMEKQSYQGENIVASRKKIEDILDSLITAFEQQQDRLFRTEAMDVEADIQVLETMMAKDGLVTPKGLDLRAAGGRK